MNILGLYIGSARSVYTRDAYDRLTRDCNKETERADRVQIEAGQLRRTLEVTKSELTAANNAIAAAATRERGLELENKQLASNTDELRTRIRQQEAEIIAAQKGRIEHNEVLYRVGKSWANFKKAWQFRKDNPKMAPTQRIENNQALDDGITEINAYLPTQIYDPSKKATKDTAGDVQDAGSYKSIRNKVKPSD